MNAASRGFSSVLGVGAALVPRSAPLRDHRAWLHALSSLTVVRMAPVALSLAGTRLRPATLAFVGRFGPRGLTSILYARIVVGEGLSVAGLLESIVTLSVLLSTVLHGVTAYPLARHYGERLAATREGTREDHRRVPVLLARIRYAKRRRARPRPESPGTRPRPDA